MGALEVVDGNKWLNLLKITSYSIEPLSMAEKIEIALSVTIMMFAVIMSFFSYQMSKQFGWNIYKKIGADVQIQSNVPPQLFIFMSTHISELEMYRVFQFFVLALKIDIFTSFMVSIFYLIQFAMKQGIMWESIIQVIVTIFILPMLYFARTAVTYIYKATKKKKSDTFCS